MPKQKSHRGLTKRIKTTGSGKLMRRKAGRGHYRLAKGKNRFPPAGRHRWSVTGRRSDRSSHDQDLGRANHG